MPDDVVALNTRKTAENQERSPQVWEHEASLSGPLLNTTGT